MARISTDMGAYKQRLGMLQGDSFSFTFTLKSDGELVDFTDCTAVLQVRERFADEEAGKPPLATLTQASGLTLGGVTGIITITLTPSQTQELGTKFKRARFQLRITDTTSGIVVTVLRGEIRTDRSVIG